jgi:hypothetical protein
LNRRETIESLKRPRDHLDHSVLSDKDIRALVSMSLSSTIRQMENPEYDRVVRVGDITPTAVEELDRRMRNAMAVAEANRPAREEPENL